MVLSVGAVLAKNRGDLIAHDAEHLCEVSEGWP